MHLAKGKLSDEAREKIKVKSFEKLGVTAYSGYITVNVTTGSHLFFLLTEAATKKDNAPLVLWLQGGPGKSSMYGQYLEAGPVGLKADGTTYAREKTIQKHSNVLFVDQPTGAGLSFLTNYTDRRYYAKTLGDMADSMEVFLKQFLDLFPEYKGRKFFITGESYGARAAVGLAERLRCGTMISQTDLPLAGVILGAGFLAPLLDLIDSSEFLYHVRLLDEMGRQKFSQQFQLIKALVKQQNITFALGLLSRTVLNLRMGGEKSLFQTLTGFTDHGNAIKPLRPPEADAYAQYVNTSSFKADLHVPDKVRLDALRPIVAMMLGAGDYFASVEKELINVLEYQKVLLYTAQLDAVFPSINFDRYFRNMTWKYQEEFNKLKKKPWYSCEATPRLLGYVTKAETLTYATVLRAGHHAARDETFSVYDLTSRFIINTGFADKLECSQARADER
ncbi:unnamed protein product [Ixodes hexagonus]